jgi:uncharacterized protein
MRAVAIVNRTRDRVLATAVRVADQWWQRARGFLGRPEPQSGEGLLLNPCRAIHMIGMKYSLDVVFLDRQGRVLALYPRLGPGRRSSWHARARYAIEVQVGTIEASGTQVGDLIAWIPADGADLASQGFDGRLDHAAAAAGRSNQSHT